VHVVVPDAIDDPRRPSGGNRYDRQLCDGLTRAGWTVVEHAVPDSWPTLGDAGRRALAALLADIPDDALVLVDGLVAAPGANVLVPEAERHRLVVLVHAPVAADSPHRTGERVALHAARAVVVPSGWARDRVATAYGLARGVVHVAEPGVRAARLATGTADGTGFLCVAAVAPHKGHDVLLDALAQVRDPRWRCVVAGSLEEDPDFVAALRTRAAAHGLTRHLRLTGPLTETELDAEFGSADLLVHPSRGETYGMAVAEALARGVPVVASAVGGVPEAVASAPDGARPALLVPPGDPDALAHALRRWLAEPGLRRHLRRAARARRRTLPDWSHTTAGVVRALRAASGDAAR
jgi:glycosyltransferase involved in cell wall biosynthesis